MRRWTVRLVGLGLITVMLGVLLLVVHAVAEGPHAAVGAQLRLVAATVGGLGATAVGLMLLAGSRGRPARDELLLPAGMAGLGLSGICYVLSVVDGRHLWVYGLALTLMVLAVSVLTVGLWHPGSGSALSRGESVVLGVTAGVGLAGGVAGFNLVAVHTTVVAMIPTSTGIGRFLDTFRLQAGLVAVAVLLGLAVLGALRPGRRPRPSWRTWLAGALSLSLGSVVYELARFETVALHGTLASTVGGVLWLASGLVLLWTAGEGFRSQSEAASIAREERVRLAMAADLHRGLAQDLALVSSHGARLAGLTSEHEGHARLVAEASRRALDETRGVITMLRQPVEHADAHPDPPVTSGRAVGHERDVPRGARSRPGARASG